MVDDASPDGTQEVAKQLAGIYGEDRVVSGHSAWDSFHSLGSDRSLGPEAKSGEARSGVS